MSRFESKPETANSEGGTGYTDVNYATHSFATQESAHIYAIYVSSSSSVNPPEHASALIFSPNVSTVDGGVHGRQAIIFLSPYIPTVDRAALPRQTLNDAIYTRTRVGCPRAHARA